MSYPDQLQAKVGLLEDSLARLGKFDSWPAIETISGEPWGTRNRAQFQPASQGAGWGFFAQSSRETVVLQECPVLSEELQGSWNHLPEGFDPLAQRRERAAFAWGAQGRSHFVLPGMPSQEATVRILGLYFHFAVDGFFQSNLSLVPAMVERALDGLSGRRALDLYGGVGLFGRFLEPRFERVDVVESDPRAARLAGRNLVRALYHQEFVEPWLAAGIESRALDDVDCVLVDPPRSGLETRVVDHLVAIGTPNLRYVSCGHDTLARDLKRFREAGYRLERVTLVDLYPQTPHLEVVCALRRGD